MEQRRERAVRGGDEWQRRQAGKQPSYARWNLMRDVSSQQRWRRQMEADQAHREAAQQQRHGGRADDSQGGQHYWQWYDGGSEQQQRHGPQFAWQRSQPQFSNLPSAVLQAGDVLGLPQLKQPVAPAVTGSAPAVWDVADIKAAFKRRALQTHPDMPNGDHQAFQINAKAYDTLIAYVVQQTSNVAHTKP